MCLQCLEIWWHIFPLYVTQMKINVSIPSNLHFPVVRILKIFLYDWIFKKNSGIFVLTGKVLVWRPTQLCHLRIACTSQRNKGFSDKIDSEPVCCLSWVLLTLILFPHWEPWICTFIELPLDGMLVDPFLSWPYFPLVHFYWRKGVWGLCATCQRASLVQTALLHKRIGTGEESYGPQEISFCFCTSIALWNFHISFLRLPVHKYGLEQMILNTKICILKPRQLALLNLFLNILITRLGNGLGANIFARQVWEPKFGPPEPRDSNPAHLQLWSSCGKIGGGSRKIPGSWRAS